jgi:type IX secretion system PorP/SprF family membrane protein
MNGGSRVGMNYRDQWPGIPGTFVTYALAYDQYFSKWKSGFGVLLVRDVAGNGNLSLTDIGLLYSFDFKLNKYWHVRPGIHFKYSQRSVDFYRLIFGDQIIDEGGEFTIVDNTTEIPPLEKLRYPDVASSILFYNQQYWAGFTWDHLLRPNESLLGGKARTPFKFSFFGGTKFNLNKGRTKYTEESLSVTVLYKKQHKYDQFDIGVYWTKTPIVLGLYFRGMPFLMETSKGYDNIDAAIVLVGYKLRALSIGYSYDITISPLMGSSQGSHEISLVYEFNYDVRIRVRRTRSAIACPRF